ECNLHRPLRQLKQLRHLHFQPQLHDNNKKKNNNNSNSNNNKKHINDQQQPQHLEHHAQGRQPHDDVQPPADLHQAAEQLAHVGSRKTSEELRQLSHLRRALQQQHPQQKQQQHQQQQHPQAADPSQQLLPPRRLVLLAGPGAWSQSVVSEALDRWRSMAEGPGLRVLRADVREPSAKAWMGQELDVVVLSAHRRRFLDSFGAVCGALRGGGVLLLETPAFEDWKRQRLGVRWCRLLEKVQLDPAVSPWITVCGEGQAIPDLVRPLQERRKRPVDEELKPNQEQRKLLEAVLQVTGSGPLCVYGRRGRGKS
ncbi:unnamed protein product, partial [Polarella glacialis]